MDFTKIDEIIERWSKTGLLEGVHAKDSCALCLNAQMKFNETDEAVPNWKRASIPVIRRLFNHCECFNRNYFYNYFEHGDLKPNVHIFKTKFKPLVAELKQEAEYVSELSESLAAELDNLFKDKFNRDILFRGISCNSDGDVFMFYNLP